MIDDVKYADHQGKDLGSLNTTAGSRIFIRKDETGTPRSRTRVAVTNGYAEISYGVYIYHFSFYVTLTSEFTGLSPWPLFAARVAATFALAIPSYYWLEQPVRRGKMLTGWQPWVAMPVAVLAVVAMLTLAARAPSRPSVDLTDLSESDRLVEVEGRCPGVNVYLTSALHGTGIETVRSLIPPASTAARLTPGPQPRAFWICESS